MKRGSASNRLADFYLGIPLVNLAAAFRRKGIQPVNPTRVGLFINPALGDTLLASSVVQDVRELYPNAKLILFATKANLAAARLLPAIDSIEILPITRPVRAIQVIRKSSLDMMLDFTAWQRITALYTMMSNAGFTVGFERKKQYRHRGYDETVPHQGNCHELENLRRLTHFLGTRTHALPRLILPEASPVLAAYENADLVVFHPWASGARSWLREWHEDRWVRLSGEMKAEGRIFLVTGSPADKDRCDALCRRLIAGGVQAEVLIGEQGIAQVAHVLARASLLVSVNTGIMHLGAILGTPTISINGPTSAHRWGPVGARVANVSPSDGRGGYLDLGFEYRGRPTDVMESISVADVMLAVNQILGTQTA